MELCFYQRTSSAPRPSRDAEGAITSTGVLGELVSEESTYVTEDIVTIYGEEGTAVADLEVGNFITVELSYGGDVVVCDLYRVS